MPIKNSEEPTKTETQLGITVQVKSSEARVAPAIYRNTDDTVDYYMIEVTWRQEFFGARSPDFSDILQDQLRGMIVQYTVAKRFSVIQAFHEQHFSMYDEFAAEWPGTFVNPFTVCGRKALVAHRVQALDRYFKKLVNSECAPNALSELAVFLELPYPHGCMLTRPMAASLNDKTLVVAHGGEEGRSAPSSIVLAVRPPLEHGDASGGSAVFFVGDVVKILKEGSGFQGRTGRVTESDSRIGQVKIDVIAPPESPLPKAPGLKVYKYSEVELVSRPYQGGDKGGDNEEDMVEVFVGEVNVHLPTGILLTKGMRRQFEYEERIKASHVDIDVEVERLWEENKRLRQENEALAVAQAAKGGDRVARKAAEKAAVAAKRQADKHRAEKTQLTAQLEAAKQKHAEELRKHQELLRTSSTGSMTSVSSAGSSSTLTMRAAAASGRGARHTAALGAAALVGSRGFSSTDHDTTLQEAVNTLKDGSASESSVLHALKRLINLSLNSEEHALQLSDVGAIPCIDNAMAKFEGSASIQEKAFKLLVNLSFMSTKASDEMLQLGLVSRMIGALERHPASAGVQVKGLWSLKNLAHHAPGAKAVLAHKGVTVCVRGVKTHMALPQVVSSGLGLLQNVAHHCDPALVASEFRAGGLSFAALRRVHAGTPDVLDVVTQLERDFAS